MIMIRPEEDMSVCTKFITVVADLHLKINANLIITLQENQGIAKFI